MNYYAVQSNTFWHYIFLETVSDSDIQDVARKADLTYAELHNLYGELGIPQSDIENQERIAKTTDFKVQAVHVLRHWWQTKGTHATRNVILNALQECKYNRAKATLEEKWGFTIKGRRHIILNTSLKVRRKEIKVC